MSFLLTRLGAAAIVIALKSFVIFALIGLMPGDPVDLLMTANPDATPEDVAKLRSIYGVDQPIVTRYLSWLLGAVQGDLGFSRIQHRPVLEVVVPALGNTLMLTGSAFLISTTIALTLGTVAALCTGRWPDKAINLLAYCGISLPGFWLGLLLIYVFAVKLGMLPAGGMPRPGEAHPAWAYIVLPLATLTTVEIGGLTRYTRAAVLEVIGQDYVRTAHAKGLSTGRVVVRHVLRNAMIPVVTVIALDFGHLLSGVTLIETMFGWRGMGRLIYESIMGNDYNLALVCLLATTAMILMGSILADIAYAWLDPRIGLGERR